MGVPLCDVCEKCGSTLAEGPDTHLDPVPHLWEAEWVVNKSTGQRSIRQYCIRNCGVEETVPFTDKPMRFEPFADGEHKDDSANPLRVRLFDV